MSNYMRVVGVVSGFFLGALVGTQIHAAAEDECDTPRSPLVVDVNGDGIRLGPKGVGVYFDLYGNGNPVHTQWVRKGGDEAFLVADLNANGAVDDGSELFGEGTNLVLEGRRAINGYIALQQYDAPALGGNDDGLISEADAVWPMLRIWTDKDANGKSERSEMQTPESLGLVAFETIPKFSKYVDAAGNVMPYYSWVVRAGGGKTTMVDVFFAPLP